MFQLKLFSLEAFESWHSVDVRDSPESAIWSSFPNNLNELMWWWSAPRWLRGHVSPFSVRVECFCDIPSNKMPLIGMPAAMKAALTTHQNTGAPLMENSGWRPNNTVVIVSRQKTMSYLPTQLRVNILVKKTTQSTLMWPKMSYCLPRTVRAIFSFAALSSQFLRWFSIYFS